MATALGNSEQLTTILCLNCSQKIQNNSNFCSNCGNSTKLICTGCNSEVSIFLKSCQTCKTYISESIQKRKELIEAEKIQKTEQKKYAEDQKKLIDSVQAPAPPKIQNLKQGLHVLWLVRQNTTGQDATKPEPPGSRGGAKSSEHRLQREDFVDHFQQNRLFELEKATTDDNRYKALFSSCPNATINTCSVSDAKLTIENSKRRIRTFFGSEKPSNIKEDNLLIIWSGGADKTGAWLCDDGVLPFSDLIDLFNRSAAKKRNAHLIVVCDSPNSNKLILYVKRLKIPNITIQSATSQKYPRVYEMLFSKLWCAYMAELITIWEVLDDLVQYGIVPTTYSTLPSDKIPIPFLCWETLLKTEGKDFFLARPHRPDLDFVITEVDSLKSKRVDILPVTKEPQQKNDKDPDIKTKLPNPVEDLNTNKPVSKDKLDENFSNFRKITSQNINNIKEILVDLIGNKVGVLEILNAVDGCLKFDTSNKVDTIANILTNIFQTFNKEFVIKFIIG